MKKLILTMAFVFATDITLINANQSDKTKELVEEYGCASDCVRDARAGALEFATDHENRGAGSELMTLYGQFYTSCYDANCA